MTDTTQTPDDEFAAAFADLQKPAAPSTPAAAAAPAAPAEAAVSPSASAPAGTDAPAAAAAAPSGDEASPTSAASGAATPAASAEAPTTTADQPAGAPAADAAAPAAQPDLAAQVAALTAQLEEMKKAPTAPAAPETPAAPQPVYTDDEKKIVEDYLKEWPDMARGEALLRRAEYQQLVGWMFEQLRPRLEALESGYQTTSTRTQYQDIVTLVPDYDQVRDATLAWIDTQPAYLKAAYQQVANEGSPQDVADLISRFKKETNYAAAASTPAPTPAPAARGAAPAPATPAGGLAPAAAAAAASLRVVKTSRSEPVTAPDPNDFDAAFKEFASAG